MPYYTHTPHGSRLALLAATCLFLLPLFFNKLNAQQFDRIYDNIAEAKALAYAHERPLLVVLGSLICSHCNNFDDKIFFKPAFRQYAADKRIVLFHQRNDTALRVQVEKDYKKDAGMNSLLPLVYMFKVRDGRTLVASEQSPAQTRVDI